MTCSISLLSKKALDKICNPKQDPGIPKEEYEEICLKNRKYFKMFLVIGIAQSTQLFSGQYKPIELSMAGVSASLPILWALLCRSYQWYFHMFLTLCVCTHSFLSFVDQEYSIASFVTSTTLHAQTFYIKRQEDVFDDGYLCSTLSHLYR